MKKSITKKYNPQTQQKEEFIPEKLDNRAILK